LGLASEHIKEKKYIYIYAHRTAKDCTVPRPKHQDRPYNELLPLPFCTYMYVWQNSTAPSWRTCCTRSLPFCKS